MSTILQRVFHVSFAFVLIGFLTSSNPTHAQVKVDPKAKSKGIVISPEPIEIPAGAPLSIRTPVTSPGTIKDVKGWAIETRRHRWIATCMTISPDGTLLATGGYDGAVRIWELATGKLQRILVGHDSYVYGVAFSPDGQYLATTGSYDYTARIWSVKTGQPLRILKGHKGYTYAVAFSHDGKSLAVAGDTSGFITFWNLTTMKQTKTVENGVHVSGLSWSPDGTKIASACSKNSTAIWEIDTGKISKTLEQEGGDAYAVSWSNDGKRIATGGQTSTIVWDAESYKQLATIKGQGYTAAFSPDGKTLAVAASSGPVQLFDAPNFASAKQVMAAATALGWAHDAKTLAAISGREAQTWNPRDGKLSNPIPIAETNTILWNQGRPLVAGIGTNTLSYWDTATGKFLHKLEGHYSTVLVAKWSRDGRLLATGSADKSVKVWDLNGKNTRTLDGFAGPVNAVAWGADGRIAVGADKTIRIFPPDKQPIDLTGHTHPVMGLTWSREGGLFASASDDRNVMLWNQQTGKPTKTIDAITDLQTVAISPDSKMVAAGGKDGKVRVWSLPAGKLLHTFERGGSPPNCNMIAWSPDGTMLASARANHTMQICSIASDKVLHDIVCMAPVQAVSWSTDGKTVSTSTTDRCVRFWEAATGKLRATLIADDKQVTAIDGSGHYRVFAEASSELLYVVLTETGMDTLPAKAMAAKYAWKNNSANVKLLGN